MTKEELDLAETGYKPTKPIIKCNSVQIRDLNNFDEPLFDGSIRKFLMSIYQRFFLIQFVLNVWQK